MAEERRDVELEERGPGGDVEAHDIEVEEPSPDFQAHDVEVEERDVEVE